MVAAVLVSRPQKVCAPWRASSQAFVRQQATRRRPGLQQVCGDVALAEGRGDDGPGAHDLGARHDARNRR